MILGTAIVAGSITTGIVLGGSNHSVVKKPKTSNVHQQPSDPKVTTTPLSVVSQFVFVS